MTLRERNPDKKEKVSSSSDILVATWEGGTAIPRMKGGGLLGGKNCIRDTKGGVAKD